MSLPRPTPMVAVAHSPTPSIGQDRRPRSNGEGKNALAACDSWCSAKSTRPSSSRAPSPDRSGRWSSFSLHPERAGLEERGEAARRGAEIGLEHALELEQRLVVEADGLEVVRRRCRPPRQAVVDGVGREARVALLAREALLLRRGDDLAVAQQARGAVVVERRDAEDPDRLACPHRSVRSPRRWSTIATVRENQEGVMVCQPGPCSTERTPLPRPAGRPE